MECFFDAVCCLCAGAAGEPVGVLLSGKAGAASAALQDPAVAGLAQLGYSVAACMEALQRLKGDADAAHQDLFARLTGKHCAHTYDTLLFCATYTL